MSALRGAVDLDVLSFVDGPQVKFDTKEYMSSNFGLITDNVSANVSSFTLLIIAYLAITCLVGMVACCWSGAKSAVQHLIRHALFNGIIVWQRLAFLRVVTSALVAMLRGVSAGPLFLLIVEAIYPILMAAMLLRYRRVLDSSTWLKERIGQSY